jgi:hypothetical protein
VFGTFNWAALFHLHFHSFNQSMQSKHSQMFKVAGPAPLLSREWQSDRKKMVQMQPNRWAGARLPFTM